MVFVALSRIIYFPWSRSEKSVNEVLEPLGIVIKTVAIMTQWLTHIRKTKLGVRKMLVMAQDDHWWFPRVCDAEPMPMLTTDNLPQYFPEINRKQNTGSGLSGKTDRYPDSRRRQGSEMWKEVYKCNVCFWRGRLASFIRNYPLTSFSGKNADSCHLQYFEWKRFLNKWKILSK